MNHPPASIFEMDEMENKELYCSSLRTGEGQLFLAGG